MISITATIQDTIYDAYYKKDASNCKKALLFTASVLLTPVGVMTSVADTLIAIIESVANICKKDPALERQLKQKFKNISLSFAHPLKLIFYPTKSNRTFTSSPPNSNHTPMFSPFDLTISGVGRGFASVVVSSSIKTFARNNSLSIDNPIQRHLISRCLYLLSGIAGIVARIVDLAIGLIAPLPLLFYDPEMSLQLFTRGLMITGIFSDIGYAIAKTINPCTLQELKLRKQPPKII